MTSSSFGHYPSPPVSQTNKNAHTILCNAHAASSSFLHIFNVTQSNRQAQGAPADEEQDLLRAMLVFASAGLDSMVKQLVIDALPLVINQNRGADEKFRDYVERRIRRSGEIDYRLLANVLTSDRPKDGLVENLVAELTSVSLQSTEQLLRVGASFDVPSNEICRDIEKLKLTFRVRNEIVHEMDLDRINSNRRTREKQEMIDFTNEIFFVAKAFLEGVEKKLNPVGD